MSEAAIPGTVIHSQAPIRICDLGGWTDTWFAEYGRVLNIGVSPFAEVQVAVEAASRGDGQIVIHAEDFGDRYLFDRHSYSSSQGYFRHPLLEASIEYIDPPDTVTLEISIHSETPPGASAGTSAAVTVALLGALDTLTPGRMTRQQVAEAAQKVETELLGQQCGIQDQLCCAFGGFNYIEMERYPHAAVTQLALSSPIKNALAQRLVVVYLGRSHASSETHQMVIEAMEGLGPDNRYLQALRQTAPAGRDALNGGDLAGFGRTMIENHQAQGNLHPDLISAEAEAVAEIANQYGAAGWKVNGAGGAGGSLTILSSDDSDEKQAMLRALEAEDPEFSILPIKLSPKGLSVQVDRP